MEVSESYVMSNNHEDLFFFDKVTGEIVYKYTLPHKYSYPKSITDMVVDGNYLYHAVKEFNGEKVHSYLYCLDFKKQKMIWTLDMQVSFCSCMRIGDILVASTSLHTYLLCPRSGEEICVFPVGGQLYKTFILDKPILYIISNDKIICLDGLLEHTLNECWRYQASDAVESSIVVYNNCVWISSKDNIIHGLDCVTGSLKIKKKTSSFPRNFTIADDKLIALSDKGQVVCYSM